MSNKRIFIAFMTIVRREVGRFFRIWTQTMLPSVVTSVLYFLIFGAFIGSQVRPISGVSYMEFIVPGLVMMAVITNSFQNVVGSFFTSKFMKSIEEILVSPMPSWVIIAGYTTGGVLRGVVVGALVLIVSLFFTSISITHLGLVILFMVLTAFLFSFAGLFNALFAKNFDQISIIPVFVLTPLTYLGGVFYSVKALPAFWQNLSYLNPILYMVNGFRYGFSGISDVNITSGLLILVGLNAILAFVDWRLIEKGVGLKN
ncbi:MAG: ABC transporter permease [Patescibacteria group bacterium]